MSAPRDITDLKCPITYEIMFDPVQGIPLNPNEECVHALERSSFEVLIQEQGEPRCPLCKTLFSDVCISSAIRSTIQEELKNNPDLYKELHLTPALLIKCIKTGRRLDDVIKILTCSRSMDAEDKKEEKEGKEEKARPSITYLNNPTLLFDNKNALRHLVSELVEIEDITISEMKQYINFIKKLLPYINAEGLKDGFDEDDSFLFGVLFNKKCNLPESKYSEYGLLEEFSSKWIPLIVPLLNRVSVAYELSPLEILCQMDGDLHNDYDADGDIWRRHADILLPAIKAENATKRDIKGLFPLYWLFHKRPNFMQEHAQVFIPMITPDVLNTMGKYHVIEGVDDYNESLLQLLIHGNWGNEFLLEHADQLIPLITPQGLNAFTDKISSALYIWVRKSHIDFFIRYADQLVPNITSEGLQGVNKEYQKTVLYKLSKTQKGIALLTKYADHFIRLITNEGLNWICPKTKSSPRQELIKTAEGRHFLGLLEKDKKADTIAHSSSSLSSSSSSQSSSSKLSSLSSTEKTSTELKPSDQPTSPGDLSLFNKKRSREEKEEAREETLDERLVKPKVVTEATPKEESAAVIPEGGGGLAAKK